MDTVSQSRDVPFAVAVAVAAGPGMDAKIQHTPAATANFARNIAAWKLYLPDDCIATMIKMGWHHST
jgi:hypothetical protein